MSMSGVDISSHQGGMDCGKTKADFFIVKATQGTSYVNPYFCCSRVSGGDPLLYSHHFRCSALFPRERG